MKVFVVVEDNAPKMKEEHQIVEMFSDKFQAEFFVKHAQVGEFQVMDGKVVFRSR